MGTYRAEVSNSTAVVLRHEGDDGHTVEVHGTPVPPWVQEQVRQGERYLVSLGFSDYQAGDVGTPGTTSTAAEAPPGQ